MTFLSVASISGFLRRIPNGLLIALFGLFVVTAAWINLFYRTDYERAEEMKRFTRENDGKARAFEEHTRRVLKTADSALLYLQQEYIRYGRVTGSMLDFIEWAKREPSINQLAVTNSAGDLILSQVQQKAVNIAHREHFQVQRQNSSLGLFISKPVVTQVSGTWSFFLSRRLTAPDGSFGGIVSVGLNPSYFSDYYDTLALGTDQSIMLIGQDRIVRCWRFNRQMSIGNDLTGSPLFTQAKRAATGHYEVLSGIDGRRRLSSYRIMPDFPLIVVVAATKESALASFTSRQQSYYLSTTLFSLFVAWFCHLLIRAEGRTRRQNVRIAEELLQRERAAEALRESQDLFAEFLNHLPAVAFVKDMQGTILYSNQAFKELFGHDRTGGNFQQFQSPTPALLQAIPRDEPTSSEETVVDPQGRERTFDTRRFLVERSGKEPLVGLIAVDISGRRHAQKLEAIGTLAGGVAHDFNNILTAITGFAALLQMKLPPGDAQRGYVDNILIAADRAAHLTRSLLAFGRRQESDLKEVDLNCVFRNIERLLRRLISEDVEFRTELADRELTVMADSAQLEQVLMNLVVNARDAMSAGGRLTVGSEAFVMDESWIERHRFGAAGAYGLISVSDTGTGMDRQTLRRVFEPFFTTKEVGKGTGLGLSLVYGIVKQHGGFIDAQSELGSGTTFRIYLPLVASSSPKLERSETGPMTGGSETILLAEDDAQVRSMTRDILEEFGYRVLVAEDGAEAVASSRHHGDDIKLVILDVIMPRKNGKEAYDAIRRIAPGIRVLFISGYTADVISRRGISEEKLLFLSKPVTPEALLRKVRETLDAPCS